MPKTITKAAAPKKAAITKAAAPKVKPGTPCPFAETNSSDKPAGRDFCKMGGRKNPGCAAGNRPDCLPYQEMAGTAEPEGKPDGDDAQD